MLPAELTLLVYLPKQLGLDRVWLTLSMIQNYLHENSLFDPVFVCTGRSTERNLVDNMALDLARKGLPHVVTLELGDDRFFGGLSLVHEQVKHIVLGQGHPPVADLSEKLFSLYALEWVANTLQIQKIPHGEPENNLLKALDEAHKEQESLGGEELPPPAIEIEIETSPLPEGGARASKQVYSSQFNSKQASKRQLKVNEDELVENDAFRETAYQVWS